MQEWKSSGTEFQLIDIRESYEVEICSLGGVNIPMAEVLTATDQIKKDVPVIIHCKSGRRSAAVVHSLEQKFNFENLYSLEGGILAWIDQMDQSLVRY